MTDFDYMSVLKMAEVIRRREASPVEIMETCLQRIQELEPQLNAFVTIMADTAMADAQRCENMVMRGEDLGPLHGVPMSVKDLIAIGGVKQAFGSRTMKNNIADADAPAVERLKAAGACILGKTTTTEFGCKPSSDSPLTGITRNPWNLEKTSGGSSAGAAASIAAGAHPAGLGTDGGGSIRIPCSFCGLFGIKAQFGRVPVYPTSATPTLAHVGPITRTVRDAALVLGVISGLDARDPSSIAEPNPDFTASCEEPVKGMRIAWSPTLGYAEPTDEVAAIAAEAANIFEDLGCEITLVEEIMEDPFDMWISEFYAGVGTKLKEPLAKNRDIIDPTLVDMLASALDQTIDEYYRTVFARYEFREQMRKFFDGFDLLLTPTLPVTAFDADLQKPPELPEKNIVNWISYTYPMNLCGLPSASLPCGQTGDKLPVGLQLTSRLNRETDIFRAASAFEAVRPWIDNKPAMLN